MLLIAAWLLFMQDPKLLELETQLASAGEAYRADILNQLADEMLATDAQASKGYAEQALAQARRLGQEKEQANALYHLGNALLNLDQYNEARDQLEEAGAAYQSLEDQTGVAKVLLNLSSVHESLGNLDDGLKAALSALKDFDSGLGEVVDRARCYNQIGIIYYRLRQYDQAKTYWERALEIYVGSNKELSRSGVLNNLGVLAQDRGDYQEALRYFEETLAIAEKFKDKQGIADAYNNMAIAYFDLGQPDRCIDYYQKALVLSTEMGDRFSISLILNNLGDLYTKEGDLQQARQHLDRALAVAQEIEAKSLQVTVLDSLASLYEAEGDHTKALEAFRALSSLKDEMFTSESNQKLAEMRARFDSEKQRREIELLKKDREIANLTRNGVLIAVAFLAGFVFLLFNRYRLKARTHELILEKNRELERLSRTDVLTDLINRRYILELIEQEALRFQRYGQPFSLVLSDIDHFKKFNDTHGHDCGDFVLRGVSQAIREVTRREDFVARWGGEEFLFFLPETDLVGAVKLADRVRESIAASQFQYSDRSLSVTMTSGVCQYTGEENIDDCLKRADNALYQGKSQGRNCVVQA